MPVQEIKQPHFQAPDPATAFNNRYLTPKQSERIDYLNPTPREGINYTEHAGLKCFNLPDLRSSWHQYWNTYSSNFEKVVVHEHQLCLITLESIDENGQQIQKSEILKPGTYYLYKKTTKKIAIVNANEPLIENKEVDLKIATIPEGHFNRVTSNQDPSKKHYLKPGRHAYYTNAKNEKVVEPYSLEAKVNDKTIIARTCTGKLTIEISSESRDRKLLKVHSRGATEIDSDATAEIIRISNKIQEIVLNNQVVTLSDNKQVTVNVRVRYQIPDESSAEKLITKFYKPGQNTSANIQYGIKNLSEKILKDQVKEMDFDQLIKAIRFTNIDPANNDSGVNFLSVSFLKITPDAAYSSALSQDTLSEINSNSANELKYLENTSSDDYKAIEKQRLKEKERAYRVQINQLKLKLPPAEQTTNDLLFDSANEQTDRKHVPGAARARAPSLSLSELPLIKFIPPSSKDPLDTFASQEYFNSRARAGHINYQSHSTDVLIPCVSQHYLKSLMSFSEWMSQWFSWITFNSPTERVVAKNEIALIRINGIPEFLGPGKYKNLPSSVEWLNQVIKINGENFHFQHDSIHVIKVSSKRNSYYVEDNTLYDAQGDLKGGVELDVGTHILDKATLNCREITCTPTARFVRKNADELSRTKEKHDSLPEKDSRNKLISCNIQMNEVGIMFDEQGELVILQPGSHHIDPKCKFYSTFPIGEFKVELNFETYSVDRVCVNVPATVTCKIPMEKVKEAIIKFGVNDIHAEIKALATELVMRHICAWNYITKTKTTETEGCEYIPTNSDDVAEGPEVLHNGILRTLQSDTELQEGGIEIINIDIGKITAKNRDIENAQESAYVAKINKVQEVRDAVLKGPDAQELDRRFKTAEQLLNSKIQKIRDGVSGSNLVALNLNAPRPQASAPPALQVLSVQQTH